MQLYKQVSETKIYNLQAFKKDKRVFSFKKFGKMDQCIAVLYTGRRSSKIFLAGKRDE